MLEIARRHFHFIVVTVVLVLVMTFPTIVYVFQPDVFWLPEKINRDVFISFWDIWYGNQVLTEEADRFYTDLIFYPEGVTLAYQPLNFPYIIAMNLLYRLMPVSNAFSLTYLLIICSNALAAYVYLIWLFKDRWLGLFGAVIFGFSPLVIGYPGWPSIAWITPIPLVVYCAHRGIREERTAVVFCAGLFAGLTSVTILYMFVCVLISLGLFVFGLAVSNWRERAFWAHVLLLIATVTLVSSWRIIPMLQDQSALDRANELVGGRLVGADAMSFFINSKNPILGPLAESVLQLPADTHVNRKNYLGFVPLALMTIGLLSKGTRRKTLPWILLLLAFLVLSLGRVLVINGTTFESIRLPKYYLNHLLPFVFGAFSRLNVFIAGAWLPLAISACFGILALRGRFALAARPGFVLALIAIVALEYYSPIDESVEPTWATDALEERSAYLDWLQKEDEGDIALVNLPFGWSFARTYSYFQTLSGYPQAEGAISRTPDSAYVYINGNFILSAWNSYRPIHCETSRPRRLSGGAGGAGSGRLQPHCPPSRLCCRGGACRGEL